MRSHKLMSMALFMIVLMISLPMVFADTLRIQYDENGNMRKLDDGNLRVYNSLNQLELIKNGTGTGSPILEEYIYHPTEERIILKRVYNSDEAVAEIVYYVDENFVRVVNASGSFDFTYVMHEGQKIAQEMDGEKLYVHADHLGSSTIITDEAGVVIENTTYSPFGEVLTGSTVSRFDYEGKEYDPLVGDTDFHFRKYKSEWGLFTQPDTLLPNLYEPKELNRYSFEFNNPYRYVDPNGRWALEVQVGPSGGVGFIAGGASGGVAISYSRESGFEFGLSGSLDKGVGRFAGEIDVEAMYTHDAKNLNDLKGRSLKTGTEVFVGKGGGLGVGFSSKDGGSSLLDSLYSIDPIPISYSAKAGIGFGAAGYLLDSNTGVIRLIKIGGSDQADETKSSRSRSGGHCVNCQSRERQHKPGDKIKGGGVCGVTASCV
jgi:RHS repeat-associated protein